MSADEEVGGVWTVTWQYAGTRFFDTDDGTLAHTIAARLSEQGRDRVQVIGPVMADIPEAEIARIKATVMERIKSDKRSAALREAIG